MSAFSVAWHDLRARQHSAVGASLVLRYVIRPMGRVFAAAAYVAGMTPNMVTAASALLSLVGIVAIAALTPSFWVGVLVAFCLVVGFGLDSADGQVARLSGTSSLAGEWLDHVVDAGKMVLVHGAVLVAWYRFSGFDEAWLLVPLAYQFVEVMMYAGLTIVGVLKRTRPKPAGAATRSPSMLRSVLLVPADFGTLGLSFLVWGSLSAYRTVYVVLLVLNAVILAGFLVKWFRELQEPEAG